MEKEIDDESLKKKGRMKKSHFLMTLEEKEAWKRQAELNVRSYLFSIGQPLVYKKDGQMIAEYADGTIKKL